MSSLTHTLTAVPDLQTLISVGVSERAKSRLSRTPSKDSDDVTGSAHSTPSRQGKEASKQESSTQQNNSDGQGKSSFFATLDWTEEPGTMQEEEAPVQRSEAQVCGYRLSSA